MANPITKINVSLINAPAPSTKQKTGAIISTGGTTLASNTYSLLTQQSSLTSLLASPLAVTSIAWATGTATVTTTAPHGITTSDTFLTTISGATPAVYNGTFLATATGASAFTYALASDGGTSPATGTITYTGRNVAELVAMNNTFWAQGNTASVYVLELGAGEPSASVTALSTYLTSNPGFFYVYLVPKSFDGLSGYLTLLTNNSNPTSQVYFYTTSTTGTYTDYTPLMKAAYVLVPAPTTPTTEFTAAAPFWDLLNTSPSSANKVAPFEYRYAFGVTDWAPANNGPTLTAIKAGGANYMALGSEGGISQSIVIGGQYADGNPVNYWYSVDWAQINSDLVLSNEVINGSNNSTNPLYYEQSGINRLQQRVASLFGNGISYGLVLNPVAQAELNAADFIQALDAGTYAGVTVVNAEPFTAFITENPSDYAIGLYTGITTAYTPLRGFDQIVFNLNVSNFG